MENDYKVEAQQALVLLERVDLKGSEVSAYLAVNNLLGKLSSGELIVVEPNPPGEDK